MKIARSFFCFVTNLKLRRTHTEKYCETLLEYKHKASKGGDGVKKIYEIQELRIDSTGSEFEKAIYYRC